MADKTEISENSDKQDSKNIVDQIKKNLCHIPKELLINKYLYSFKKKLSADNYSYRCVNRNICTTLLTISKKDFENIKNKNDTIINPKLNKNHTYKGNIIESTNANEVKTEAELVKLPSELISLNTDKTLGWHVQKLDEQNIHLKFHVIKNLVYSNKQSKYINDDLFLLNEKIKITLDKNKSNLTDLPFCF